MTTKCLIVEVWRFPNVWSWNIMQTDYFGNFTQFIDFEATNFGLWTKWDFNGFLWFEEYCYMYDDKVHYESFQEVMTGVPFIYFLERFWIQKMCLHLHFGGDRMITHELNRLQGVAAQNCVRFPQTNIHKFVIIWILISCNLNIDQLTHYLPRTKTIWYFILKSCDLN